MAMSAFEVKGELPPRYSEGLGLLVYCHSNRLLWLLSRKIEPWFAPCRRWLGERVASCRRSRTPAAGYRHGEGCTRCFIENSQFQRQLHNESHHTQQPPVNVRWAWAIWARQFQFKRLTGAATIRPSAPTTFTSTAITSSVAHGGESGVIGFGSLGQEVREGDETCPAAETTIYMTLSPRYRTRL